MHLRRLVPALIALAAVVPAAHAQTIIEEWADIKAPAAPALKPVKIDPKDTALLMLDYVKPLCGARPRCVAVVPKVQPLLAKARDTGMLVVFSLAAGQTAADVMPELAAKPGEPVVTSGPDKFLNTDLEKILKDRGIKTVIVGGTAAEGAVLNTASQAALRGLRVIVPVDAIASVQPYSEQYTVWHLGNSPRVGPQVTLTRLDQITF
jgi:nicotinamidase-related amidase